MTDDETALREMLAKGSDATFRYMTPALLGHFEAEERLPSC